MSSHHVTYERFPDVSDVGVEFDGDVDVLRPCRGILLGIAVCAPVWAAVYLVFRAVWN
jgi:hypothetical protein